VNLSSKARETALLIGYWLSAMGQGASSKFEGRRDARALLMRHLFFAQDSQNIERRKFDVADPAIS
jgi:hypothetical protein